MHCWADIFTICIVIIKASGKTCSGFVLVFHACLYLHLNGVYRFYMQVGADMLRVCIGITCMSVPTFSGLLYILHAYRADIFTV